MSAAILGTFVAIKTMSDGTPRITFDMQCSLADVAAMGLMPGVPFAVARLTNEASLKPAAAVAASNSVVKESLPTEPKQRAGQLCVMACTFCDDGYFWKWLEFADCIYCDSEARAKAYVLDKCGIESRKELDTDPMAAASFHEFIRKPFMAWRDANSNGRRSA